MELNLKGFENKEILDDFFIKYLKFFKLDIKRTQECRMWKTFQQLYTKDMHM